MSVINGRKITVGDSPLSSGQFAHPTPERAQVPDSPTLHPATITVRDRVLGWIDRSRDYWVPPNLLTQPPASLAELSDYAHWAGWTSRTDGPIRTAGILWHRAIGIPATAVCRYVEWTAQRPGRAIPVFGVWKLFILTGPGPAIADNIIRPCLGFLAWVLL
jgi:hypothetical protein